MKIAIVSDSHDNIWKLAAAMPHLAEADAVIHCGDLVAPFMIIRLIKGTDGKPVHLVWGNNDGDKGLIAEVASQAENITLHGDFAHLELGGLRSQLTTIQKLLVPLPKVVAMMWSAMDTIISRMKNGSVIHFSSIRVS